ncbi:putative exonuclease GOR [Coccinella septempunctata]|uniref:putative exonuclease GOR n=1 Tax=Coccinella septempunctata TaxID=41139 RepID=UPI001D07D7F0|nr:putative exonuclease GOR [Coccinella septempunctata]
MATKEPRTYAFGFLCLEYFEREKKQSDVGSSSCPQQQRPNEKKCRKPFPNIYKPIRSARDETPSQDCSGSITIKSENRIGDVSKERNNPHKAEDAVSPVFGLTEERLYNLLIQFTVSPEDLFSNGYPQVDKVKNQVRLFEHCFGILQGFRRNWLILRRILIGIHRQQLRGPALDATTFFVNDHGYLTEHQQCFYHWGKISYCRHTCCENTSGSKGCTSSKHHVWNGTVVNEALQGFSVIEFEELCRVTVLEFDGATVYDYFVQPEEEVVDYNTRFSGVTESDVYGQNSKTFKEVQSDLLTFINEDTILIGHALDNDLRVLKLVHSKIVDTSLIFPHQRGFPFRNSLKNLMSVHLNKQIQTSNHGNSPYEDALSCLELIMVKIQLYYAQRRLTI